MVQEVDLPETLKKKQPLPERPWFRLTMAGIFVFLLASACGASGYFYRAYKKTASEKEALVSQMTVAPEKAEVGMIVEAVSKLVELPEGETPTLATVSDKSKLESQAFFQRAENGDKVLFFSVAGKAILYRPSAGKVIDMTAVNVSPETEPSSSPEKTLSQPSSEENLAATSSEPVPSDADESGKQSEIPKPFSVAVANGTSAAGLARKVGERIQGSFPASTIADILDAKKKEYASTVVVDRAGSFPDEARRVAELLGGEVGTLPEGERIPPNADIFVVVGEGKSRERGTLSPEL